MEMPQEIVVWYLLPALRKELVIELKNFKLSQKDIAQKLNITEAAISQYMHNKRASNHIKLTDVLKKEIKKSAITIKTSNDPHIVMKELIRLTNVSTKERILCSECAIGNPKCKLCRMNS
jgi:predicted transcriptional regulator